MRIFLALFVGAVLLLSFSTKPTKERFNSYLLEFDPLLARAISVHARTLVADFVWLKSSYVDEIGAGSNADNDLIARVAHAQITLDPHFVRPAIYAATYLASIAERADQALEILSHSQSLNPNNFDTLFGEAMIRINYGVENSSGRIVELAALIEPLPEKTKQVGAMRMDDLLIELVAYSREKEGKRELIASDLETLYKTTTNPKRKELIRSELERVIRSD